MTGGWGIMREGRGACKRREGGGGFLMERRRKVKRKERGWFFVVSILIKEDERGIKFGKRKQMNKKSINIPLSIRLYPTHTPKP